MSVICMLLSVILPSDMCRESERADPFPGRDHPFQEPRPTDLRGPCPGINALANHGFIDRSGLSIPVNHLRDQLSRVYNVDSDFLDTVPIQGAIDNGLVNTQSDGTVTLDLNRLSDAKVMEHDASFFRHDSMDGQPTSEGPDAALVQGLLDMNDDDKLTFNEIKEYQSSRLLHSLNANPEASFNDDDIFGMAEQAMFILMMGQNDFKHVKKQVLSDWVLGGRLDTGYKPPTASDYPVVTIDGDQAEELLESFRANIETILCANTDRVCS